MRRAAIKAGEAWRRAFSRALSRAPTALCVHTKVTLASGCLPGNCLPNDHGAIELARGCAVAHRTSLRKAGERAFSFKIADDLARWHFLSPSLLLSLFFVAFKKRKGNEETFSLCRRREVRRRNEKFDKNVLTRRCLKHFDVPFRQTERKCLVRSTFCQLSSLCECTTCHEMTLDSTISSIFLLCNFA